MDSKLSYRDKYHYYFSYDGILFGEVFLVSAPEMIETQESGSVFYRRKVNKDLIITSKLNPFIFKKLAVFYFDENQQNVRVRLRIQKNGVLDWEGSQPLRACRIDIDTGTFTFKPEPDDEFSDYLDVNEKEIDIIDGDISQRTLTFTQTSRTEETIFLTEEEYLEHLSGEPDFENKWTLCTHPGIYPATYKRQRVPIKPNNLWYQVGDEYAFASCEVITVQTQIGPFRRLTDTINYMLNKVELPLSFYSQFINEYANYVTGTTPNPLLNIYIAQKSDVKRPDATEQANTAYATLKEVLEWIEYLLNAKYTIENSKLRVEHLTYFESTIVGLDLTSMKFDKIQQYEEDGSELVRNEKWELMESKTVEFLPERTTIEYDKDRTSKTTRLYSLNRLTTDLRHVINNAEDISDEGFVMVVADDGGDILSELSWQGYVQHHNMHLSIAKLQQHYWMHLRPLKRGVIDNEEQSFLSEVRKRKQKSVQFILTDSINCDVTKLVRTNLIQYEPNDDEYYTTPQIGKIETKVHDLGTDKVTLELKYREDDVIKSVNEAVALVLRKSMKEESYLGLSVKGSGNSLSEKRKVSSIPGKVNLVNLLKTNSENEYLVNVGFI